jgi:hypothetical protein
MRGEPITMHFAYPSVLIAGCAEGSSPSAVFASLPEEAMEADIRLSSAIVPEP